MAVLRLGQGGDIVSSSQGDVASLNTSVNNIVIDEDSFATDSSTRAPSQQSVKAYIATQIATTDNTDEIAEGSTNLYFTDARARAVSIENVSEDPTPQLGADLDVNGNKIISVTNGNIDIEPHGTGNVLLGNFTFDADQAVGSGQDDYVLRYNHTTGLISLEAGSGSLVDVVDDTSPQLGADLDTNSFNIKIDDAHGIFDDDNNEQLIFQKTASAVNELEITNAATGNAPSIGASGETNVSFKILPKGTGKVIVGTGSGDATVTSNGAHNLILDTNSGTDSGNITITDAANGNINISPNGTGSLKINAGSGIDLNGKQLFSSSAQSIVRVDTNDLTGAFSATKNIGGYDNTGSEPFTDLAKHVPIYFSVQGIASAGLGAVDTFNTGSITSVRTGATARELDLRLMNDDASNQVAQVILTRDTNGYHQTEIGNKAGDFRQPLNVIARTEGLSGSNQNSVPVIKITKETSNDSRRIPIVFTHLNGGTEHFLVNTFARESGSKKRFGINFLADDGSLLNGGGGSGYQGDMVEFSQETSSNFEARQTLRGRLQIEHGSANIANTINMITALDSSDDTQNFMTATVTKGTGSTPDDNISGTFSFKANNAADSSQRFIGELKFQYDDGAEDQNKVRLRTKSYDGNSNLGEITLSGQSADFTVPATMPTYAVGSLPTASIDAGAMAFATGLNSSDVSTGKAMVFYDGSNWKYMHLPATTARA